MGAKRGKQFLDGINHLNRIGSRLPKNRKRNAAPAIEPACGLVVFHSIYYLSEIFETDGSAIAVSDDKGAVISGLGELTIRLNRECLVRAIQNARGQIHVGGLNCIGDLVNADLPAGQRLGVEFGVNGVFLRAVHAHLRHTAHHRNALRHQCFCVFIDV